VEIGNRNNKLFRECLLAAPHAQSFEELWRVAGQRNAEFGAPLPDAEVRSCARSAWQYQLTGRNLCAGGISTIEKLWRVDIRAAPDALFLFTWIERANFARDEFVLTKALARQLGWGDRRFRRAREALEKAGIFTCVRRGGRWPSDPPIYRWSGSS
jgi:hypothetical protein